MEIFELRTLYYFLTLIIYFLYRVEFNNGMAFVFWYFLIFPIYFLNRVGDCSATAAVQLLN